MGKKNKPNLDVNVKKPKVVKLHKNTVDDTQHGMTPGGENIQSKLKKHPSKLANTDKSTATVTVAHGVKRKFEESESKVQHGNVQSSNQHKKFKKRKLKESTARETTQSSATKTNNMNPAKESVDSVAPVENTSPKVAAAATGLKNKMNVQPNKNWEALLKVYK